MTVQEAAQKLLFQLFHIYEEREARNIADLVMEHVTGWKRIDRILNKQVPVSATMETLLQRYTGELLAHKPVQYVLGETWFYGMKFCVNEHVLIPRPETEELVEWIISDARLQETNPKPRILDIGTGSGCIAIALKKFLADAEVFACDISKEALAVAAGNARLNGIGIHLVECDFLNHIQRNRLGTFDIVVSNPPYIPAAERAGMQLNVVNYEPHVALFVADNNPLVFYDAISGFSRANLLEGGLVYMEINERLGGPVEELLKSKDFEVSLKKDLQGKDRMVKAYQVRKDR
jgi:release factor glutamine methyltransferase